MHNKHDPEMEFIVKDTLTLQREYARELAKRELTRSVNHRLPGEPRRAKVLDDKQIDRAVRHVQSKAAPASDELKLLLSHYAGLRAAEISTLTLDAVCDAEGRIGNSIWIAGCRSKNGRERFIPMHPKIKASLVQFRQRHPDLTYFAFSVKGGVIRRQKPNTCAVWFRRIYLELGFIGCSSHSGRRGFITRAARIAGRYGQSIYDVQRLAGHARLDTTAAYIDISEDLTALVHGIGKTSRARTMRAPRF